MKIKHFLSLLLLSVGTLAAEVTVDPIFASDMVLQQGKIIPVTGKVTGNTTDSISVSFAGQHVTASITGDSWRAELQPLAASAEGRTLTVTQGEQTIALNNILVGEVWLASGQSNMLWRLNQTGDRKAMAEADIPNLRYFHNEPQIHTSPRHYTDAEKQKLVDGKMFVGSWAASTPQTCPRMSAVGFYFGRKLQETLGVPVGIIHSSLGGSEMMAWMPTRTTQEKYSDCLTPQWLESKYMSAWVRGRAKFNNKGDITAPHPYQPTYLYKTGIEPWVNFPIAGVIWYQGESDAEIQDQEQNTKLLTDLIQGWRAEFANPALPFLMVQLPRIKDNSPLRAYWPEFRQVQHNVAKALPGVDYIVTTDLGSNNSDVHPPRKLEVGERLAHLAAATVYAQKDDPALSPVISEVRYHGKTAFVRFANAKELSTTDGKPARHFELAGKDGKFYPATVTIHGNKLKLTAPEVKQAAGVRYAWATYLEPNLVNENKLPAAPYAP